MTNNYTRDQSLAQRTNLSSPPNSPLRPPANTSNEAGSATNTQPLEESLAAILTQIEVPIDQLAAAEARRLPTGQLANQLIGGWFECDKCRVKRPNHCQHTATEFDKPLCEYCFQHTQFNDVALQAAWCITGGHETTCGAYVSGDNEPEECFNCRFGPSQPTPEPPRNIEELAEEELNAPPSRGPRLDLKKMLDRFGALESGTKRTSGEGDTVEGSKKWQKIAGGQGIFKRLTNVVSREAVLSGGMVDVTNDRMFTRWNGKRIWRNM